MIVTGIIALIWGGLIVQNASVSSDWPSVKGEITKSKVEKKTERVKKNDRWQTKTTFWAGVQYSYSVDGTEFVGGKISFGDYGGEQEHARQIVKRFKKGKAVDVYYDPEEPKTAVLEPGTSNSSYLVLGIGLASLIAGIVSYFLKR